MTTENPTPGQIMWAEHQPILREGEEVCNALHIPAEAARELTNRIKTGLEGIFDQIYEVEQLLLEAHNRRAWQALGYKTWEEYVKTEFDLSRRRSYQLLDQARVIN